MFQQSTLRRAIFLPEARRLTDALSAAGEPLLFGIRLWASVCLALYVAFWLQLDHPFWAGTSAAIVCQPRLGASLRKGWFRMIGTVVGAVTIVVLTGCFPQNRVAFLGFLALWCGLCAFAATVFRNFASYAAALAGYTAAIIAADNLGPTGGPNADVFLLAVWRASEICIGIACAGIVLAGTDFGGAQRRLAESFAGLATEIVGRFFRTLTLAGPQLHDARTERRELVRRVIALDPMIDQAVGESSEVHYHSSLLQSAVYGLLRALDAWRVAATHLIRLADVTDLQSAKTILFCVPSELRSTREPTTRWLVDPIAQRRVCEGAARRLLALQVGKPSLRLLVDETAKVLAGMVWVLDALALLVNAPERRAPAHPGFRLSSPDWLPALVNAARAFLVIAVLELFWVASAWPGGAVAIEFAAIVLLLLSPNGDLAYDAAIAFTLGSVGSVVCVALIKFAVLPGLETFPALSLALGLYLIPIGFALAQSRKPATVALFTGMTITFVPLLAPTNEMNYDTAQYYNLVLALFAGTGVGAVAFRLLPLPSPRFLARRLLAFTLRDLRRLAIAPLPPKSEEWDRRMYGRLAALPDQAEPLQRSRILAALSVGTAIIQLRQMAAHLRAAVELDAALAAFARGRSAIAIAQLRQLDYRLSGSDTAQETAIALRARGRLLVISDALAEHTSYFDAGESV